MDEIHLGIYDDLEVHPDLDVEYNKLQDVNKQLSQRIDKLEAEIVNLQSELAAMKNIQATMERNISSLFKTARTELDRKDQNIAGLQRQLDDFLFRRGDNKKSTDRIENSRHGSTPKSNRNSPPLTIRKDRPKSPKYNNRRVSPVAQEKIRSKSPFNPNKQNRYDYNNRKPEVKTERRDRGRERDRERRKSPNAKRNRSDDRRSPNSKRTKHYNDDDRDHKDDKSSYKSYKQQNYKDKHEDREMVINKNHLDQKERNRDKRDASKKGKHIEPSVVEAVNNKTSEKSLENVKIKDRNQVQVTVNVETKEIAANTKPETNIDVNMDVDNKDIASDKRKREETSKENRKHEKEITQSNRNNKDVDRPASSSQSAPEHKEPVISLKEKRPVPEKLEKLREKAKKNEKVTTENRQPNIQTKDGHVNSDESKGKISKRKNSIKVENLDKSNEQLILTSTCTPSLPIDIVQNENVGSTNNTGTVIDNALTPLDVNLKNSNIVLHTQCSTKAIVSSQSNNSSDCDTITSNKDAVINSPVHDLILETSKSVCLDNTLTSGNPLKGKPRPKRRYGAVKMVD